MMAYVKHSALGANRNDSQLACRLCRAVSAVVPGHVQGARQVRGLWEMQVTISVARDRLPSKGFIFKERERSLSIMRIHLLHRTFLLNKSPFVAYLLAVVIHIL